MIYNYKLNRECYTYEKDHSWWISTIHNEEMSKTFLSESNISNNPCENIVKAYEWNKVFIIFPVTIFSNILFSRYRSDYTNKMIEFKNYRSIKVVFQYVLKRKIKMLTYDCHWNYPCGRYVNDWIEYTSFEYKLLVEKVDRPEIIPSKNDLFGSRGCDSVRIKEWSGINND